MARKKRFTKKMLEIYDKAEIRRIAINAMNLPTESAYMMDFKQITAWVFDQADVFSQVEITKEMCDGYFREDVLEYTTQLQQFIRGEAEAPEWPLVSTNVEKTPEPVKEEPEEEPEQADFIYATDPELENEPEHAEESVEDAVEEVKEKPRRLRRKAKTAPKEAEVAPQTVVMDWAPVKDLISNAMGGLDQKLTAQDANLRGGLAYRLKGIERALLTIINLLVEEEDAISSIEDVPEP